MGSRNHVLDGVQIPHGRGNYKRERGSPLQSIVTFCCELCKNGWIDQDAIWVMDLGGPKEACIRWGPDPPCEGEGHAQACLTTLCHELYKMAEMMDFHLGCGFRWAKASASSIVFARWYQCALMGGHIGISRRIQLNRPSVAVMWPYVKLIWPLIIIRVHYPSEREKIIRTVLLCCVRQLYTM